MTDLNPRAVAGGNNPPADPFSAHEANITDLYQEAKHWLDGEEITTQAQADAVTKLLDSIRDAHAAADASRVLENKPFDDGKSKVQAKYAPLISDTKSVKGMTILASEACRAALAPWRRAQEAAKLAAAEKAREEAEAAAEAAAKAMRTSAADDLAAREEAEQLVRLAAMADRLATKADKAATTGTGLRSTWAPTLTDGVAAARHYWGAEREKCEAFFLTLAKADVLAGKRTIPGFEIEESRRAI